MRKKISCGLMILGVLVLFGSIMYYGSRVEGAFEEPLCGWLVLAGEVLFIIGSYVYSRGYIKTIKVLSKSDCCYFVDFGVNRSELLRPAWKVVTTDGEELMCKPLIYASLEEGKSYVVRVSYGGEILSIEE